MQQPEAIDAGKVLEEVESQHDEEECHGGCQQEMPLVDRVDDAACQRTADDRTNLEKGHCQTGLHFATAQLLHDENRKSGNQNILSHEQEEIAPAHAEKLRGP